MRDTKSKERTEFKDRLDIGACKRERARDDSRGLQ